MSNNILIKDIQGKIYFLRNLRVMLDYDLADLYGAETRALKQAVKRNIERFPSDFMFELNKDEFDNLRSQDVISSWGGSRYAPMAFTELGIAMLSSVLKSDKAIQVNIQIMRAFIALRHMLIGYKELKRKIESIEKKYDHKFKIVFEVITSLIEGEMKPKKRIGF